MVTYALLPNIKDSGIIVLDKQMLIIREYMKQVSLSGQPGLGDAFFKWLFENQAVEEICEQVSITPVNDSFAEFPNDPELSSFDISDRKFVATALASKLSPIILNALDSDWRDHANAFSKINLNINELCKQCLKSNS